MTYSWLRGGGYGVVEDTHRGGYLAVAIAAAIAGSEEARRKVALNSMSMASDNICLDFVAIMNCSRGL